MPVLESLSASRNLSLAMISWILRRPGHTETLTSFWAMVRERRNDDDWICNANFSMGVVYRLI